MFLKIGFSGYTYILNTMGKQRKLLILNNPSKQDKINTGTF